MGSNTNTNGPALPPMIASPTPSPDKPKVKPKANNSKPTVKRKMVTKKPKSPFKPKKAKQTKKKKRKGKNRNDLTARTNSNDWSDSEGSVGSLVDFVDDGDGHASDEDYDVRDDLGNNKGKKRVDSVGLLIDDDEYDLNGSFDSLMDIDLQGNSMDMTPPPKKQRKGTRTVLHMLPLCSYGMKCYRKNKHHLKEYGHPWK